MIGLMSEVRRWKKKVVNYRWLSVGTICCVVVNFIFYFLFSHDIFIFFLVDICS